MVLILIVFNVLFHENILERDCGFFTNLYAALLWRDRSFGQKILNDIK